MEILPKLPFKDPSIAARPELHCAAIKMYNILKIILNVEYEGGFSMLCYIRRALTSVLVILTLLFIPALNAADPLSNDIVARLERSEKEIRAASFDYVQEIAYPLTGEKQVSSGRFAFQKPACLRIEQKTPAEQLIVSNGRKVWIHTPLYRQVLVDTWKRWMKNSAVPSSLMNFGTAWSGMKKKYTVKRSGTEDGMPVLTMEPKNAGDWKMKFWINEETLVPARMQLAGENVIITTRTSRYVKNPPMPASSFDFAPPEGTETIQLP